MSTQENDDYLYNYVEDSPSLPSTPAWKLELIKKKKRSSTSSSFSHFDRSRKTSQLVEERDGCPSVTSPTKTKDIINFFNKTTDVAVPNLSPKRSLRTVAQRHPVSKPDNKTEPKTSNGMSDNSPALPAKDRPYTPPGRAAPANSHTGQVSSQTSWASLARPAIVHPIRTLSCGVAEGRTGKSNKCEQPNRGTVTLKQTDKPGFGLDDIIELSTACLSDDGEDDIGQYKVIWSEGQTACDRYPGEEEADFVFSQPMGEDKRLFVSNGRNEVDNARVAGVGARLYRGRQANKRNIGRGLSGNGAGDSDGMMGSGGESDSSEEIHYGPGFVSRLKSRYMSVALRGSARGSLGALRRTASLEDFLEIDKNRDEEEVELRQPHTLVSQFNRHSVPLPASTSSTSSTVAAKVQI